MSFVHLHCHSPYSFLDGASSIDVLVKKAAEMDMPALAITDHNNLCAVVQFDRVARAAGIKPIQGVEITLESGHHLTLLAKGPTGYTSLCHLLSRAHLGHPRGEPQAGEADLDSLQDLFILSGCRKGLITSMILERRYSEVVQKAMAYRDLMGRESFFIELQNPLQPGSHYINHRLCQLADQLQLQTVASNNVHYNEKEDFILHDLLCCVRTLTSVEAIHPERPVNGESYLKSPREMKDLFIGCPNAFENTLRIAAQCQPVLSKQTYHFPRYPLLPSQDAVTVLCEKCWDGARKRYSRINEAIASRLEHELQIIIQMGFADYFLVVWDLVQYAQKEGIRCAGRGSAADSLVAYCLNITEVDSLKRGLLFERFLNPERLGMPDIDIDFESRYRDQVIQYVYQKYGSDHVARVATYNTFRARSAIRELGKALGFAESELNPLCKSMPFYAYADHIRGLMAKLPELKNSPLHDPRYRLLLDCCERLAGFPRFLGMHLGGLVISDVPIRDLSPLQESALGPVISQFDKEDIEELGLIKLDLLPLRTLSVIQDTSRGIEQSGQLFDYEEIPMNDQETFAMINRGETIGVFQLESPAQRALQTRFNAAEFEDVVASMALIRPGPIKGNMVEPYVERRHGREEVSYMHPLLEPILKKTYGVVLFQEQVIEIARAIAGFSPGEADQFRRIMTHSRSQKAMHELGDSFIKRSVQRGIEQATAEKIFACMGGYASYGFCEAHAAAFANTSYKTAYLVQHYPAEYYTAILNNQPMGFYPPRIIGNEARRRGIELLPPDVCSSNADFMVEGDKQIRVGLKQLKGMIATALASLILAREQKQFKSVLDLVMRCNIPLDILENLLRCGAMDGLCSNRRYSLSQLSYYLEKKRTHQNGEALLFDGEAANTDNFNAIKDFTEFEKREWEYQLLGLYTGEHPMQSFRPVLNKKGFYSSKELGKLAANNRQVKIAGLLLYPHRPPTRSGRITVFFSLEDEFGMIDITMFENVYMKYGSYIFGPQSGPLMVIGRLQRRGEGVSVVAESVKFLNFVGR